MKLAIAGKLASFIVVYAFLNVSLQWVGVSAGYILTLSLLYGLLLGRLFVDDLDRLFEWWDRR